MANPGFCFAQGGLRPECAVRASARDGSRTTRSRMPRDGSASRPCCRKRRRGAGGTNSSWPPAGVRRSRDSTQSREALRAAGRQRRARSLRSASPRARHGGCRNCQGRGRNERSERFRHRNLLERRLDFRIAPYITPFVPAKAGTQPWVWIPACAGMNGVGAGHSVMRRRNALRLLRPTILAVGWAKAQNGSLSKEESQRLCPRAFCFIYDVAWARRHPRLSYVAKPSVAPLPTLHWYLGLDSRLRGNERSLRALLDAGSRDSA